MEKKKQQEINLYWKAREFKPIERTVDWYWFFWIIIFLIIVLLIYFNDTKSGVILSLLVFLIGALSTYITTQKPNLNQYRIDDDGFYINNGRKNIPFEKVAAYNIDKERGYIYIDTTNKYERVIEIPFENNHNIDVIDEVLAEKIKKNKDLKIPTFEMLLRSFLGW